MERELERFDVQDLHSFFEIATKAKEQFRKAQENYANLSNQPKYSHLAKDTPAVMGEVRTYITIIQLVIKTKSFNRKMTRDLLFKFLQEPTDEHLQKVWKISKTICFFS